MICPCCKLQVESDMMVDVSKAPEELTKGATQVCTGCLDGWYRQGRKIKGKKVSRADIHEAVYNEKVDREHPYWSKK